MTIRSKVAKAVIRNRRSVKELQMLLRNEVRRREQVELDMKRQEERFARLFGYRVDCHYNPENDTFRSCLSLDVKALKGLQDNRALIYDVASQLVGRILKSQ